MKIFIKKSLQRIGWYEYLKYSFFFSMYTFLFKKEVIKNHRKEVSFYKSFLPHCRLIFDIGAYDGHKTAAFLEIAEQVVCCEPDSQNFRTLQIRFRNFKSRVFLHNKALSDHTGTETYFIHHAGSAFNTLNPKWKQILENDNVKRWEEKIQFSAQTSVQLTTLDRLIQVHGKPEFIKIDVEGYEQWVLSGLSEKVPYLSFECLLPDCESELRNCLTHLSQLDPIIKFNIAYEENLIFKNFIGYSEINEWIPNANFSSFEVVAKMTM